ncbi:MAG TPA: hypothetical protein VJ227_04910 [Patescibacteria group bacterium]|nr:hypothetical protein [Patescibacteria group bacterium]
MAKRKKGQIPYESEHPERIWMPDVPGHRRKGGHGRAAVVVSDEQKEELERQVERLRDEITTSSGENKG